MTGTGQGPIDGGNQRGYALAALLVGIAVMGVMMAVAMPVWRNAVIREKEEELIFRGEQYARAIGLFQRKFAGAFPASVDVLVEQKFLRRKYKDPMVADGQFQVLYQLSQAAQPGRPTPPAGSPPAPSQGMTPEAGQPAGQSSPFGAGTAGPRGAMIGVVSKSTAQSMRLYRGRSRYNEWQFVYTQVTVRGGTPGGAAGRPGGPSFPGGAGPLPGQPGTFRPPSPVPTPRRPGVP